MKNISFERTVDRNQFTFKDNRGTDFCFEYRPSIKGLWENIKFENFDVQLLIHPFLNKESNIFALQANIKASKETVGYLFPVAALDSDNFEARRPSDNNYLFVAYNVLLERLDSIENEAVISLSECFESNICVCVLNLQTIGKGQGVWNCMHSLRKYGYSYFVEENRYREIDGYNYRYYKELLHGSKMNVTFSTPLMCANPIVDGILRSLPNADNIVYRFILLYQIVELLISKNITQSINDAITAFQTSLSSCENDFIESINNVRKERGIIKDIFEQCGVAQASDCNKKFNEKCRHLFNVAGISLPKSEDNLFYDFRNKIVHSYRHFNNFKEELSETIFYYEQVVLTIVEKYPSVV